MTDVQTKSYDRFLQLEVPPEKRTATGLEGVLREIFPIESYDKTLSLQYIKYELGKPRYGPDECRQLRLTYGRPFRVWLRLNKEQPVEEEVYLGDMPIMIGGGEFIINGAERVVVSQLHRSPGVDYVVETEAGDRKLHSCRVIPERGSWIEVNVTKKDALGVRIDQSGKFSAMTLLRAMDPSYTNDEDIIKAFYPSHVKTVAVKSDTRVALEGCVAVGDIIDPETGEIYLESGETLTREVVDKMVAAGIKQVDVLHLKDERGKPLDQLVLTSLKEDPTSTHEEALLKIYQRLRPGNPPQLEKAKELFREKFQDPNRYRLGKVGRFRINRKFNQDVPETEMTLAGHRLPQRGAVYPHAARPGEQSPRRRHRPPGQPPAPYHRRAGRRRAAQGIPQASPHGPGAHVDPRSAGHDAADAHQPQEHLGGHRVLLRPRRACRRWSTRPILWPS